MQNLNDFSDKQWLALLMPHIADKLLAVKAHYGEPSMLRVFIQHYRPPTPQKTEKSPYFRLTIGFHVRQDGRHVIVPIGATIFLDMDKYDYPFSIGEKEIEF